MLDERIKKKKKTLLRQTIHNRVFYHKNASQIRFVPSNRTRQASISFNLSRLQTRYMLYMYSRDQRILQREKKERERDRVRDT